MKFPVVWLIGVALLIICHCSSDAIATGSVKPQRNELDLYTPLEKINRKLQLVNFDLMKLLGFIDWFLSTCMADTTGNNLNLPEHLGTEIYNKLMEDSEQIEKIFGKVKVGEVCKSPLFATIHTYMWVDDPEKSLNDLVHFVARFGFPNIYQNIKMLYTKNECPQELIDTIPDGPSKPSSIASDNSDTSSNLREQILSNQSFSEAFPFPLSQIKLSCDATEMIRKLTETGVVSLVIYIDTLFREMVQRPSLHFLVGKIQEPAKGDSFHGMRLLKPFRKFNYQFDQLLKSILELKPLDIISKLKKATGIDLCKIQFMEAIATLFELVMWQKLAPVPPYVPDADDSQLACFG